MPTEDPSCQVWFLGLEASFVSPYAAADLDKTAGELLNVPQGLWVQVCDVDPLQVTGQ